MFSDWQTPVALAVVLIAAAALLRSAIARRNKPGCSSGCGCPTDDFKKRVKKVRSRP